MDLLRYVTHPDVTIDPSVPVPRWGLSEEGRRRATAMLGQPWVSTITRLVSSDETKALETARILGDHLELEIEVRDSIGEADRSSTGFVGPTRFEELADRFFAEPRESVSGWERAVDAQSRIVRSLADVTSPTERAGDVVVIGHGAVGTLLMCHLAALRIDRRHDQPHQGHVWTFDRRAGRLLHRWHAIDRPDPQT
jgi:broad specificity phosphatase PhoE